jgi:hypothetical protein
MTASRTCRACGADLAPNVMWCLRCFEPVRQLTPRDPPLPTVRFLNPRDERPRSRWRAGATTFGPFGRLAITALVLLCAPLRPGIFGVVAWPAYLTLAAVVLRDTWRKDFVDTTTIAELAAAGPPAKGPERSRGQIPRSTIVAWIALGLLGLGVATAWAATGRIAHAFIGVGASLTALVLAGRWLTRD